MDVYVPPGFRGDDEVEKQYYVCTDCNFGLVAIDMLEADIYHRRAFPGCQGVVILESNLTKGFESVDHPQHYNAGRFEAIDVIEDWKLGFNLGNAIKYIARADHKGNRREDLEKALWYLEREIRKGETS